MFCVRTIAQQLLYTRSQPPRFAITCRKTVPFIPCYHNSVVCIQGSRMRIKLAQQKQKIEPLLPALQQLHCIALMNCTIAHQCTIQTEFKWLGPGLHCIYSTFERILYMYVWKSNQTNKFHILITFSNQFLTNNSLLAPSTL